MMSERSHTPVMLQEVLTYLHPQDCETYVDATFGGGGYTRAFLEAAKCQVIAFDRDPDAVSNAKDLQAHFGERLSVIEAPFSEMATQLGVRGINKVQGIVFDLGVSSSQIDRPERGFSLRFDGPLNMRMDADLHKVTAHTVVNQFDEQEIANILYMYGDERKSRRIAKAIVMARGEQEIATTLQLADLVKSVMPALGPEHPATRTFQAIRIFVNDELDEFSLALKACEQLLTPGGRLVVVTFHSLEDSIIKEFLNPKATSQNSRYLPYVAPKQSSFDRLTKKPVVPSVDEVRRNPRARSAKLRAGIFRGEARP
ncbi:MAG: 16S rRNA (cytosine(1402)-N(4))-methyltransferase RsmH [Alphaproteobacteria bacterium]